MGAKKAFLLKKLEECAQAYSFKANDSKMQGLKEIYACGISLDYSFQKINNEILTHLISLAYACQMPNKIKLLFNGGRVNNTQNIPALHTALRVFDNKPIMVDGFNIIPQIEAVRQQMKDISDRIRAKQWLGQTSKPITDIVNIGIGGSDFAPRLCISALKSFVSSELNYHFISDVDPVSFSDVVVNLNPETTLFIICSKSFTTFETLHNTKKAIAWIGSESLNKHFIAVTSEIKKAEALGISQILPIWEWVGGRYSMCSAVGLIACIALGYDTFITLLQGARNMDDHFLSAPFSENMPIMLALLGIWNINFQHINNLLFLVYTTRLKLFVPYIQQLDMESNGKSVDRNGRLIESKTGPIVWGGLGNQIQHSFYQLLSQGAHKIATDFIYIDIPDNVHINTFCKSTSYVLNKGIHLDKSLDFIEGNMPINRIRVNEITPFTLGALVALYEHKIYAQSVIWNINPFDQPGVESAKKAMFNCDNTLK